MAHVKVFIIFCIASVSVTGSYVKPCKATDKECVKSSAKAFLPKLAAGFPELGMPPIDPLYIEHVIGDLSTLKFKFDNTTMTGLGLCDIQDMDLNLQENYLKLMMICPNTTYAGDYIVSGRLIVLPVEGQGDFDIFAHNYKYMLDIELKQVQGKDGKQYLSIKNFKGDAECLAPILFDIRNLFNGRKDLSDVFHKFVNENYKEVSEFTYHPLYNQQMKDAFKNINKFLKKVPMDELFLA